MCLDLKLETVALRRMKAIGIDRSVPAETAVDSGGEPKRNRKARRPGWRGFRQIAYPQSHHVRGAPRGLQLELPFLLRHPGHGNLDLLQSVQVETVRMQLHFFARSDSKGKHGRHLRTGKN